MESIVTRDIRVKRDFFGILLFLLFFCSRIAQSLFTRTVGDTAFLYFYVFCFIGLVLVCIGSGGLKSAIVPMSIYLAVAVAFLFTILLHPEYAGWFNHEMYGIVPAFLDPRAGIWALLVVFLIKEDDKLFYALKIVAWALFIFLILQFIAATVRGYWVYTDTDGSVIHNSYSLEFGYDMLLPTAFMGAMAYIYEDKRYYIPFAIGFALILLGGSRGAAIWPIVMFVLMVPFKWKKLSRRGQTNIILIAVICMVLAVVLAFAINYIGSEIGSILSELGLKSRTLTSITDGSFGDANGRKEIYSMAIDLIKKGGPLGWGIYGDRYVIGNYFRWGYSHNIFLELMVTFGFVLGGIMSVALVIGVIRMYKACDNNKKRIVFITVLVASLKLVLSNSFWYTAPFWMLLAIMIKWENSEKSFRFR